MTKQDMMNERRLREEYLRTQQQEENHDPINDLQMVDRIFSFLPNVLEDQEKEGPREFEVTFPFWELNTMISQGGPSRTGLWVTGHVQWAVLFRICYSTWPSFTIL